jgi:hypothetical protein
MRWALLAAILFWYGIAQLVMGCTENTWLKRRFFHQKYEFNNIKITPCEKLGNCRTIVSRPYEVTLSRTG